MATLFVAAGAARTPHEMSDLHLTSDDNISASPDLRYRLMGSLAYAPPTDATMKSSGYRLEGGIAGFIPDSDPPQPETPWPPSRTGDLFEVLANWGVCQQSAGCAGDVDADGIVGPDDLMMAIRGTSR